jgi:hypothetical protein
VGVWGEDVEEFKVLLLTTRFEHLSMEEHKKLHDTLTNQGLFTGILTKMNTSTSSARAPTSSVMNTVLLHTYFDSMIRSWVLVRDEFPVICLQSTKGNVNFHEVDISTTERAKS